MLTRFMWAKSDSSSRSTSSARLRSVKSRTNATASLPLFSKILFLERLNGPGLSQFCQGANVALAPFRRGQLGPVHAARNQILTGISYDTEKRVIGIDNPALEVDNEDPNDIGIDQMSDLPFAIFEVAIKPRILERDCRLGRKHFQHGDAVRGEYVRRQIVFKVENSDDFSLVDQWQTEDGTGAAPNDIRIGGKRALRRCIVDNHGLSRPHCIANE